MVTRNAAILIMTALTTASIRATPSAATVKISLQPEITHEVSPYIYGMGSYLREQRTDDTTWDLKPGLFRFGGNSSERFNYRVNSWNAGADWYFSNHTSRFPQVIDKFMRENRENGVASAITVPMLGWIAKDGNSCSYPVKMFPPQKASDQGCGNGIAANGSLLTSDPARANLQLTDEYITNWVRQLRKNFGSSPHHYIVGNEPMLWHETHRDVHPERATYDEVLAKFIRTATLIRDADPDAVIMGPALWGWLATQQSAFDERGPWSGFRKYADRDKHGGKPFLEWFVTAVRAQEKKFGKRLLDIIDVHYYPEGEAVRSGNVAIPAVRQARLQATRSLWDAAWKDQSWINQNIEFLNYLGRVAQSVSPPLGVAIGEYNFRAENDISGAIAQAELFGVFASKGLYAANYWTIPPAKSPAAMAFRLFRNYDGKGSAFGGRLIKNSLGLTKDLSCVSAGEPQSNRVTIACINKSIDHDQSVTIETEALGGQITRIRQFSYSDRDLTSFNIRTLEQNQLQSLNVSALSATMIEINYKKPLPLLQTRTSP